MVDEMRKGLLANGNTQSGKMGEVGLAQFTRIVLLGKENLFRWSLSGPPYLHSSLQTPKLSILEDAQVFSLEELK